MAYTGIHHLLATTVQQTVKELYGSDIESESVQIQNTRKEFDGHFTIVVFPFVKMARKAPEATANEIGEKLVAALDTVQSYAVVKGFLNLTMTDAFWISFLSTCMSQEQFGYGKPDSKPAVMVEYSSPNTNKPLHLGHLRNNFLGYSVAEILKALGHKVIKVQIINDRGIHICKSMVAWRRFGDGETPATHGVKGDHLVGKYYVEFGKAHKAETAARIAQGMDEEVAENEAPIMLEARETLLKWEQGDEETRALWKMMNGWVYEGMEATYAEIGVDFDKLYYESDTYLTGKQEVEKGLASGAFFKKEDGSVWCDLTGDGLDEKLVLRKDGTAVYMTQDIGTAILRYRDFEGLSYQIYTVGNEQEYHFKVLFLILGKLGFKNAQNNYHLSYGMVELPEGKMKTREGNVVDADELLREMRDTARNITAELGKLDGVSEEEKEKLYKIIGYGSLKYYLLKVDPRKSMLFNPSESVDFSGNTGSYLQYNYVRTRAILRKYGSRPSGDFNIDSLTEGEIELLQKFHDFPEVLQEAGKTYNPAELANYCYELVKTYSSFYQSHPILSEDDADRTAFRVALSVKMGEILKSALTPLGIELPERM